MDRTDRFINNRAPRRLLLIFFIILCISAAVSFFIAGICADKIVAGQIKASLSVAGGGKFTAPPDEEAIAKAVRLHLNIIEQE